MECEALRLYATTFCVWEPRVSLPSIARSVRHTGAFPNSARLVRVSCLECVFRVHASVVPPV